MIDFHAHILPNIDDGAENAEVSLNMLKISAEQGVDCLVATPHFYPDEESLKSFLERRAKAFHSLIERCNAEDNFKMPKIKLGAEVYWFKGMSNAENLDKLAIQNTRCLLVEPPMARWNEDLIEDIESIGVKQKLVPVIAHADRYARMLEDYSLFDNLSRHRVLIQTNASFFIYDECREKALELLAAGRIHFIGSDCHNEDNRRPNIGDAAKIAAEAGLAKQFAQITVNSKRVLEGN